MTEQLTPNQLAFRVSPRTMRMLGRENISSPIVSVLELVKNAYDADATRVELIFSDASTANGYITLSDNGEGMDLTALRDSWMVISTDNKVHSPRTVKGRRKVGEKGIGRLAMDRLAHQATIVTHRYGQPGWELLLDWDKYEQEAGQLHEITHPIQSVTPRHDGQSGTSIYLTQLRDQWVKRDYEALHRDLALLVPPFSQSVADFSIYFECNETPELTGDIVNPLSELAEYTLASELTAQGVIKHTLIHRSGETTTDQRTWTSAFNLSADTMATCGPLSFELYFYLRDTESLKGTNIKLNQLRQFLKQFQGIRIYRDFFRVKPYGDPGGEKDWLGLEARFARSRRGIGDKFEWRVSEAQLVGTVYISREDNPYLKDQTNREGLIQNEAYQDMQKFLLHGIQFLERERQSRHRREEKKKPVAPVKPVQETLSRSEQHLNQMVEDLRQVAQSFEPDTSTSQRLTEIAYSVEKVLLADIREVYEAEIQEKAALQTEYQLLIGLSTLGIAVTAFGHEISRVINNVQARARLLAQSIAALPSPLKEIAQKDLQILSASADRVEAWGRFALDRVRQDKRVHQDIHINETIRGILHEFEAPFAREHIVVKCQLADKLPIIKGFVMDVEAILLNLITNAREAMRYQPLGQRHIVVGTSHRPNDYEIVIHFKDSGRGIADDDLTKIFEPLFSTRVDPDGKPVGTGMGLTIVKNIVDGYNGHISVRGHGELGGAEFDIHLPHRRRNGKTNGRV